MEYTNDTPRCTIFNSTIYTIICSLVQDLLKIRVENTTQSLQQVFILNISSSQFPDYLRHTPFDTIIKLYNYIEDRKSDSIKFVDGKFSFRINEAEIGELFADKYIKIQEHEQQHKPIASQVYWDLNTIHAKEYFLGHFLQKSDPGWTQITGRQKISLKKQFHIKVKYVKYGDAYSIGIGFMTESRKNSHYSGDVQQYESLGYWSRHGYKRGCVCSNGVKIIDWDCLLYNNEGDVLSITFKPQNMTIIWDNGHKSIETQLQQVFMNKQLYLFVVMHDVGSRIQFIE